MARLARVAVPDYCYHITHRSNRRARVFVEDDFIRTFEEKLDRLLHPQKPGPKPATDD